MSKMPDFDDLGRRAAVVLDAIEKAPSEAARISILVEFYNVAGQDRVDDMLERLKVSGEMAAGKTSR